MITKKQSTISSAKEHRIMQTANIFLYTAIIFVELHIEYLHFFPL